MIRPATLSDIPFIMELGKRFADDAGVTEFFGWDDGSVRDLLETMIEGHVLLRGEKSILGGLLYQHPFNNQTTVFQEMFWRSEAHGEGLKLLAEAERIARERGATRFMMFTIDTMPGPERLYQRRGYVPADHTFIKEL